MLRIQCVFICFLALVTGCATFTQNSSQESLTTANMGPAGGEGKAASSPAPSKTLIYSALAYSQAPFIPHSEPKPFKSYVAMNLTHEPYVKLRKDLEKQLSGKLQTRPESHITVITPPEYDKVLKKRIGIQELQALADKRSLQLTPFKLLCIGKGSQQIGGTAESTYYAVVDSESLFNFRKEVQKLFVSRGGRALDFNPDLYYPHVTLGFTKRDLHLEDGVVKDASSCIFHLKVAAN